MFSVGARTFSALRVAPWWCLLMGAMGCMTMGGRKVDEQEIRNATVRQDDSEIDVNNFLPLRQHGERVEALRCISRCRPFTHPPIHNMHSCSLLQHTHIHSLTYTATKCEAQEPHARGASPVNSGGSSERHAVMLTAPALQPHPSMGPSSDLSSTTAKRFQQAV